MIGGNAQNIALTGLAQRRLNVTRAIHAVRGDKREWHLCSDRAHNHLTRDLRLRRKAHIVGHVRRCHALGIVCPFFRQIKSPVDEGMAMARHANTPIWQLVILPAEPVYCSATPHEALPCFKKPVSSMTSTASSSAKLSST